MKKELLIPLVFIIISQLFSLSIIAQHGPCNNPGNPGPDDEFEVSSTSITIPTGYTLGYLTVTTNVCWEVVSQSSWITSVSPSYGNPSNVTDFNVRVTCSTNNTGSSRTGEVVLNSNFGNTIVSVTQQSACLAPATPSTISGPNPVCPNSGSQNYSVTNVSSVDSYHWSVPHGATIISGQGTSSIRVQFGTSSGSVTVFARSSCGDSPVRSRNITVRSAPSIGSFTGNNIVCINSTETISVPGVPPYLNYNYYWDVPAGSTIQLGQNTNSIIVRYGTTSGNVTLRIQDASCGPTDLMSIPRSFPVTLIDPNQMIIGTVADREKCEGTESRDFTVSVNGTGYSYQWQERAPGDQDFIDCRGQYAIAQTYTTSSSVNGMQYQCRVSKGLCEKLSNIATLTVHSLPQITVQPTNASMCETGIGTFTITAIGPGLTYQWQYRPKGDWENCPFNGSQTPTLETDFLRNGIEYRCIVRNSHDCSVTSNIVHTTVSTDIPSDPSGLIDGPSIACINGIEEYSMQSPAPGTNYDWSLPSGSTILSSTINSITVQFGSTSGDIRVRAQRANCPALYSNYISTPVTLINSDLIVTGTVADQEKCLGDGSGKDFHVTVNGTGYSYQWQERTPSSPYFNDCRGQYATAPTYISYSDVDGMQYQCVVSEGSCEAYSNIATLRIYPTPNVSVVSSTSSYILPTEEVELTASGADTYAWSPSIGLSSTTDSIVTASPPQTTTYTVTGTTNACSDTETVTVNLITIMGGKIILSGNTLTVNATGGEPPYNYLWSNGATTNNITVSAIGIYTVTITDVRGESIDLSYNYTGSSSSNNSEENEYRKNWVHTKVFNENGTLIGESRSFSNYLGKPLQSQSKNFTNNKTMVSQTIYDAMGRPTVSTLVAPVDNTNFVYKKGFIKNNDGDDYSYLDFDGENGEKINDPDPVNNAIPNTLGSYYSDNNFDEPYVPSTQYPYSRVEYSKTNPGQARRSSMPGEAHKMGSGHTVQNYSMPVSNDELQYFLANIPDIEYKTLVKSIGVDSEGKEAVSYTSSEGHSIASCMTNGTSERQITISSAEVVGSEPSAIDIHIPKGCNPATSTTGTINQIIDLSNDETIPSITQPGFYRILGEGNISVTHNINYYNYAINVYDRGGRLKKSYSPKSTEEGLFDDMAATFKYNSLGWLLESEDPDGGISHIVYREDGKIRFSQNEQQEIDGKFSYTNYDDAGRIVEVGEYTSCPGCIVFETYAEFEVTGNPLSVHSIGEDVYSDTDPLADGLDDANCDYQSFSQYDLPDNNFQLSGYNQIILIGQVSKTWNNNATTWYSYLYDGKVDWVVQEIDIPDDASVFGITTIDYDYDAAGNVTKVMFEKDNFEERFDHVYEYDADNRLKEVTTIEYDTDGSIINTKLQAKYFYYQHGPVKRVELANGSQGIDYVYNINGWLKSINNPDLSIGSDPGKDGHAYSAVPEDIFGMSLDYYSGDYSRVGTNITSAGDLYNGNIHIQRWQTRSDEAPGLPTGATQWANQYNYNERNWLSQSLFGIIGSNESFIADANEAYRVSGLSYDANGNLLTLNRNAIDLTVEGTTSTRDMDQFEYKYYGTKNQLRQLIDNNTLTSDLEDIKPGQEDLNYEYDSIGQMIANKQEGHYFEYDVYGKVTAVYEDEAHTLPIAYYDYNEAGFRIKKTDVKNDKESWYVRDAAGSIFSIYESDAGAVKEQKEIPVYASSRVGVAYKNSSSIEKYNYELTDHLGNVRATFQNRVTALENVITLNNEVTTDQFIEAGQYIELTNGFVCDGYTFDTNIEPPAAAGDPPSVVQYSDYYPFGMVMPGRNYISNKYRFGYQGQFAEKDEETGYNQFKLRLWDGRVGRWQTTDPYKQYWSPYMAMGNNPIKVFDPTGGWGPGDPNDEFDCYVAGEVNVTATWTMPGGSGANAPDFSKYAMPDIRSIFHDYAEASKDSYLYSSENQTKWGLVREGLGLFSPNKGGPIVLILSLISTGGNIYQATERETNLYRLRKYESKLLEIQNLIHKEANSLRLENDKTSIKQNRFKPKTFGHEYYEAEWQTRNIRWTSLQDKATVVKRELDWVTREMSKSKYYEHY